MDTPDEPFWKGRACEWYGAAAMFAAERLADKRNALVIGSTAYEVNLLSQTAYVVQYADIRSNPDIDAKVTTICDACALPFPDNSFDAVSSTCVVCHAGLGRYGDPIHDNGDVAMMRGIYRVLRPGGEACIMAGPALPYLARSFVYGNVHRIYQPCDFGAMVGGIGFEVLETALWTDGAWMDPENPAPKTIIKEDGNDVAYCYLCVHLRKPK